MLVNLIRKKPTFPATYTVPRHLHSFRLESNDQVRLGEELKLFSDQVIKWVK